jgi:RNA 2',3'-cyclic 3'-phosphodiesterase
VARDRASRPEAKPLRLFAAVDVPDDVREGLASAVEPLRERLPRGRWTPPGNWHVTLKFLGRTFPRLVDWVIQNVDLVARTTGPFESRVGGLGAFPSARRARVLWAGMDDAEERLAGLAKGLEEAMAKEFAPEKRPFTPHLTVARFDPPVAIPEAVPDVESASFEIDRLLVYRSHLQRPAPRYEPIHDARLSGPSGDH